MNEIEWHPEKMLEVKLKEPDDFLKVVRHYLELVSPLVKRKNYISPVTFYTNRVSIILSISRNSLPLMARTQT